MELRNITAWLASNQPWAAGVALYEQAGRSKAFKRLFALPETPSSRTVLVRELRALVRDVPEVAASWQHAAGPAAAGAPDFIAHDKVGRHVPLPIAVPDPPAPDAAPDSPLLLDLRQQLQAARDERSHLHPQLTAKNVGIKARFALACRILDLTDAESRLLALEAHVQQHGRLPGPVPLAEVTDQGELRRRLANLRSRRCKLQKEPARAADLVQVEAHIQLILTKITPFSS